ncbi:MAG: AAA family ATPase, partial [Gammaproteobacteria bacterium]|nr:AAA family ATPase [Gammaproteobacteria bacterium]
MHRAGKPAIALDTGLVESLRDPGAFPHEAGDIELVETHISWLLLAGDFAYKIKKPLTLDFLDFSSLEKRRFYCEEELRLNRPWAPDIYLEVVPISRRDGRVRIGGDGEIVEYALRMRRFEQALRLDKQLESGLLSVADMKELGGTIAARHRRAPRVRAERRERVLRLTREFMTDNFDALYGVIGDEFLTPLREWTIAELDRHAALLAARFDNGKVRSCHGDLHLGNLVRLPAGITTFDCIEFNADLRHIDVVADTSFLVMDLVERGRSDLAAHFLNRYLEAFGDYEGVTLLNLFFVYRCLVRAKVAVIRSGERDDARDADMDLKVANDYCVMAARQSKRGSPLLVVMHGFSGSGKTRVAGELMAALPAIRIRSDIERRRLAGIGEREASGSGVGEGIYTADASERVYGRLFALARGVLASGHSVILDAAFLERRRREEALDLAREACVPAVVVDVTAGEDLLRERVAQRAAERSDPSEADVRVLEHQLATAEPLTDDEQTIAVRCDNSGEADIEPILQRI